MTEGMKTSEFYITLFAVAVGFYLATIGKDGGVIGSVMAPAIAYIGGRSYSKKGKPVV